ncbi:protein kinase [Streptomyces parvus]|uniref:protein kinase domain-containing protein n=1 Tax=Streptomyces parvus TaxID=66428 RepID=UPI003806FB4D
MGEGGGGGGPPELNGRGRPSPPPYGRTGRRPRTRCCGRPPGWRPRRPRSTGRASCTGTSSPGTSCLGPDGPLIIDFGIARAPDVSLTPTGAIMGTFGCMAPEVLAGQRAAEASGVFAWAAVVLYAATGTEPFRGENIAEVAHRTTTVEPDPGALPPEIRPLMAAALAKDPELRPTAAGLLLGLIGAPVKAADPRAALLEAGARKAAAPEADSPKPTARRRPARKERAGRPMPLMGASASSAPRRASRCR